MLQITSFYAKNFRGLGEVVLENLSPCWFLTGLNGSGKSSVLNAIQVVLNGRCYDRAGTRIQMEQLIGPNGRQADVELGVLVGATPMKLVATIQVRGMKLLGCDATGTPVLGGSPNEVRATLCKRAGLQMELLEATTSPYSMLVSKDLSVTLGNLLGGELDQAMLEAFCGGRWDWFRRFLKDHAIPCASTEHLALVGDAAEDVRKAVNKRIKELATEMSTPAPTAPQARNGDPMSVEDITLVERTLTTMSAERDQLIGERGAAGSGRSAEDIAAERARLVRTEVSLAAQADALREQVNAAIELKETHETALRDILHRQSQARAAIQESESTLKKWSSGLCNGVCGKKLAKDKIEELVGPARVELEDSKGALAELDESEAKKKQSREEAQVSIARLRPELGQLDTRLQDIRTQIAALDRERPSSARTAQEISASINETEQRIATGRAVLDTLRAMKAREELVFEKSRLDVQKENLDWAVVQFRDGAALNVLCQGGRAEFETRCNEQLAAFGFEMSVSVAGKEAEVRIRRIGAGRWVPVSQVSNGEYTLAQLAVALGFGADGPILIDSVDALDGQRRSVFFQRLMAMQPAGSVVLAGAWSRAQVPDMAELQQVFAPVGVVWMERGAVGAPAEVAA